MPALIVPGVNSADSRQALLRAAQPRLSCCRIDNAVRGAECSISMQGSAPRPRGNLWLCSSHFIAGRMHYSGEGQDLPGLAPPGCRGMQMLPPPRGVHMRILWLGFSLGRDLSRSSGNKASPCTLALLWQRNGSLPLQLAGQHSSPGTGSNQVSAPCCLCHSFPAAPHV